MYSSKKFTNLYVKYFIIRN